VRRCIGKLARDGHIPKAHGCRRSIIGQQCRHESDFHHILSSRAEGDPRRPGGAPGTPGAPGAPGPAGVVTGYQDTNSGVSVQYIATTTIATLNVPAGNYIVNAAVQLGNPPGNSDGVYCTLTDDASDFTYGDVTMAPGSTGAIPLTVAGNGATKFVVACDDSHGSATANASITAVPTSTNSDTVG